MKLSKEKLTTALFLFCMVGYLKPSFISEISIWNNFFNIVRVISLIIVLIYTFKYKFHLSIPAKMIIVYFIYYMLITAYRRGDTTQAAIGAITIIGEVCLFELIIKKDFIWFLKVLCTVLSVYVIINLMTIFIVPQGFGVTDNKTPVYFLGIHNRFVFWMLPLICYMCLYDYLTKERLTWKVYAIYSICMFTLIYKGAVGAMLGLGSFIFFFTFLNKKERKFVNYNIYLIVYYSLWIAVTFGGLLVFLQNIIYVIFDKSGSVLARLSLWNRAIKYLSVDSNHLLLGYGLEVSKVIQKKFRYVHVHNNLLNVAYQTGVVGVVLYTLPFLSVRKKLMKYNSYPVARVIAFAIFAFLFMLLADTYDLYGHFYTLLVLAGNIPVILEKVKGRNEFEK